MSSKEERVLATFVGASELVPDGNSGGLTTLAAGILVARLLRRLPESESSLGGQADGDFGTTAASLGETFVSPGCDNEPNDRLIGPAGEVLAACRSLRYQALLPALFARCTSALASGSG